MSLQCFKQLGDFLQTGGAVFVIFIGVVAVKCFFKRWKLGGKWLGDGKWILMRANSSVVV